MSPKNAWISTHLNEFEKESDRAAVILTSSIFEEVLGNLLKQFLTPLPSSRDDLFEGANSPLSTLSSKIDMCYRLGLLSAKFTRDLHQIRKIRNIFAHNITDCSFDNISIKNRVEDLYKSAKRVHDVAKKSTFDTESSRNKFCIVTNWMIYFINQKIESIEPLSEAEIEWGYLPKEKKLNQSAHSDG